MEELITRLETCGLNHDQAEESIQVLTDWLQEHYPVAGVLANGWIKAHLEKSEL